MWLKISGKNPGLTPGFEGFLWLKDTFPNKFDFLKTVTSEVIQGDHKISREEIAQRGRKNVFLDPNRDDGPNIDTGDMNFPSLGGPIVIPGELTIQQRAKKYHDSKKKGLAITGKKVFFSLKFNF